MNFHDKFRCCPACGSSRFLKNNFKSRRCADCGFVFYHNPSAACAAFLTDEAGRLLVAVRGKDPARGTYDLPGGFVDAGETAEEALSRELVEETGLHISRFDYLFSLPNDYLYSDLNVPTLDLFFSATIPARQAVQIQAADDVASLHFLPADQITPAAFGLQSVRQAVTRWLATRQG